MVFYRKYRPQTIHELDSASLRETLTAVLEKGEQHAFLFTGPKGLGKTSTARIVAKVVNCERKSKFNNQKSKSQIKSKKVENGEIDQAIEPCNKCEQCISITSGTNLDVFEIDAASNRGIDEIRDLREKIRLAPLSAKKKIYIIDEVHMLTTEAFNALLKTLEEPPAHTIFMLCTTEPQKVPATIISRCFHLAFHPATRRELIRSFERIVTGEDIQIDKEALIKIADLSEGGFRDGTKILEELASIAQGKKITVDLIEEKFKVTSTMHSVEKLIAELEKRSAKDGLSIVSESVKNGQDPKFLLAGVIESLHEILLVKAGAKSENELRIRNCELSLWELKELLELLLKAQGMGKTAVLPQLPLELAIVEWCNVDSKLKTSISAEVFDPEDSDRRASADRQSSKQDDVSEESASVEKKLSGGYEAVSSEKNGSEVTLSTVRKQVGNLAKIRALYGEEVVKKDDKNGASPSPDVSLLHFSATGEITKEWIDVFWASLILQMKSHNHTLAGVLRGCTIKSFDRKTLIIETPFKFHMERLGDMRTKTTLEGVCKELTGKAIAVSIELKAN